MRNPFKVLLKWIIYLTDKESFIRLDAKGKCNRNCKHNCCETLFGFIECPYYLEGKGCKIYKNRPMVCRVTPSLLDDMPKTCTYRWKR
jgi:Fe-S-cluster containining protein